MVEGNMGKFESQISLFSSKGQFLIERLCTFKVWNIVATSDPLLSLALLRDWQRLSLGEIVDGHYINYKPST